MLDSRQSGFVRQCNVTSLSVPSDVEFLETEYFSHFSHWLLVSGCHWAIQSPSKFQVETAASNVQWKWQCLVGQDCQYHMRLWLWLSKSPWSLWTKDRSNSCLEAWQSGSCVGMQQPLQSVVRNPAAILQLPSAWSAALHCMPGGTSYTFFLPVPSMTDWQCLTLLLLSRQWLITIYYKASPGQPWTLLVICNLSVHCSKLVQIGLQKLHCNAVASGNSSLCHVTQGLSPWFGSSIIVRSCVMVRHTLWQWLCASSIEAGILTSLIHIVTPSKRPRSSMLCFCCWKQQQQQWFRIFPEHHSESRDTCAARANNFSRERKCPGHRSNPIFWDS